MATGETAQAQERGDLRKQLVINAVLLDLIDPVRGKPTKSLLDGHPDDDILRSHQLKEKFLDAFALICSTSSSGKETASAVCMEQNRPSGTILRVARNRGLSPQDLVKLKRVLHILTTVATREKLPVQAESEVLEEVVILDESRILSLLEKLEKGGIRRVFETATSKLSSSDCKEEILKEPGFGHWIKTSPFSATSLNSGATSQLISLVKWASQARWVYPKQLQILLPSWPSGSRPNPPWMETLYKIARYWAAIKSMVKLAVKQPELFTSIHIQAVDIPLQQTFSLKSEKKPLRNALRRLVKKDCEMTISHLTKRWETNNAETKFRKACPSKLTLHAEMQLLDFYDLHPALKPQLRSMGTSKKACYLCHEFLLQHPLRLRVLACHQKVYPTWMTPPCRDLPGLTGNKLLWNFSKHIERVTVGELKTCLTAPPRPRTLDSTAGPSLTVSATVPTYL